MPERSWEPPNGWKREGVQGTRECKIDHGIWVYNGMAVVKQVDTE